MVENCEFISHGTVYNFISGLMVSNPFTTSWKHKECLRDIMTKRGWLEAIAEMLTLMERHQCQQLEGSYVPLEPLSSMLE